MNRYTDTDVQAAVVAITVARGLDPNIANPYREAHQGDWARAVLDAVAPAIAARTLREAADGIDALHPDEAPKNSAVWLRARADEIEAIA